MAAVDLMDMIQPSLPPPSEVGDPPDMDVQAHANRVQLNDGNGPIVVLAKTPEGIRALLGRKKRRRPLLAIECKGCGMTSHDPDVFVSGDTMEFLASIG